MKTFQCSNISKFERFKSSKKTNLELSKCSNILERTYSKCASLEILNFPTNYVPFNGFGFSWIYKIYWRLKHREEFVLGIKVMSAKPKNHKNNDFRDSPKWIPKATSPKRNRIIIQSCHANLLIMFTIPPSRPNMRFFPGGRCFSKEKRTTNMKLPNSIVWKGLRMGWRSWSLGLGSKKIEVGKVPQVHGI